MSKSGKLFRIPTVAVLLAISTVLLAGCADRQPLEVPESAASSTMAASSNPFIPYGEGRIELTIDPTRIVVESSADDFEQFVAARSTDLGMQLLRVDEKQRRGNWRILEIGAGRGQDGVRRASDLVDELRRDDRFDFVSQVYHRRDSGAPVLLVNRLVIRFHDHVAPGQIDSLLAAHGMIVERAPTSDSYYSTYWVRYPQGVDPLEFAVSIHRHPLVRWADPDRVGEGRRASLQTPSVYFDSLQWYLKNTVDNYHGIPVDIDVDSVWIHTKGAGIRVAVLDDGVEMWHPDIDPNFNPQTDLWYDVFNEDQGDGFPVFECDSIGCAFEPQRASPKAGDDHGTKVAGLIAGKWGGGIVGVAPEAMIIPVRFVREDETVRPTDAQLADAFEWAADVAGADVINFSYVWESSQCVAEAIRNALKYGREDLGTVVVAAAGNFSRTTPEFPASMDSVIAVGAIQRDGQLTYYSNGHPDLVAPSGPELGCGNGDILTTSLLGDFGCSDGPGGNVDYTTTFSGTSAATALVSGAAALMLAANPGLTAAQVKSRLQANADSWPNYGPAQVGSGKLNVYRSLDLPPPPPPPVVAHDILGPTIIFNPGMYQWKAVVSGGDGNYSYQWKMYWQDFQAWQNLGQDSTQSVNVDESVGDFTLRVIVTSAGTSDSTSFPVINSAGCAPLIFC